MISYWICWLSKDWIRLHWDILWLWRRLWRLGLRLRRRRSPLNYKKVNV